MLRNLIKRQMLIKSATLMESFALKNSKSNIKQLHCGNILCAPRRITKKTSDEISTPINAAAPLSVARKFKIFEDSDSSIILDSTESAPNEVSAVEVFDEFEGLNLQRGIKGVFDIEELVEVLRRENAKDIFVASIPIEYKFVEHICIVTARSPRHLYAVAEFVRRLYKKKSLPSDSLPRIEGDNSKDWMALDLGNIALHVFSEETRRIYDLEQLWSVGPEYDSESNKPNTDIVNLLERHSVYLHDLKPAKNDKSLNKKGLNEKRK